MLTDSPRSDELFDQPGSSFGRKVVAAICALLISAAVLLGYAYLRKRHAQQTLAQTSQGDSRASLPKGPPQAHILVDDALLKGGQTIIGGSVKNISSESLRGLSVELELRRRKDGV